MKYAKSGPTLLIVGTGMAGARVVQEVLDRAPGKYQIRMFGAEPHGTYNRVLLSSVLSGHRGPSQLWLHPLEWYEQHDVFVHAGIRAEAIDLGQRVVMGGAGKVVEPYDHLVLATGSRPYVPPLEGINKSGVFVFRTLEDCASIGMRAQESERAVVFGGGLLGLEAARGLLSHGLDVTVVEMATHLMPQHLDELAGAMLQRKLEKLGLQVRVGVSAQRILGGEEVSGVELQDGSALEADLVIVSCGIQPNVEEARAAGLLVDRAIVIDDQLRTSDPNVSAVGECAQYRDRVFGLLDPVYDQARTLGQILGEENSSIRYQGSQPVTALKVMGVDLTILGERPHTNDECEIFSHADPSRGMYKRFVLKDRCLQSAILLGAPDYGGKLQHLFKSGESLTARQLDELLNSSLRDESTQAPAPEARSGSPAKNKIEIMKQAKDGLECLPDLLSFAKTNNWAEMSEDDKQRAKWYGLFFRKQTPGNFMLRVRMQGGRTNARQFRVLADISDEFGKGFCDLTTRQQVQLRWFEIGHVPEMWRRLEEVGLNSKQTGMDNVRGVCGCPAAGLTLHELFNASAVADEFTKLILDNREFTNLPRKFNVTITGCLENCCHTETQDIALVPAYRELDGQQVNGFNVLVGGKQGSGGYRPAMALDVFVRPQEAAALCGEIARIFRDYGSRGSRTRARLAFLLEDRGITWFRNELEQRWGRTLYRAGADMRKKHHVDHLGIHPQRKPSSQYDGPALNYVGVLVPVGRITTAQMRGLADLAERYGNGELRLTPNQNVLIPSVPDSLIGRLTEEPLLQELSYDPSPILRGLVACTGIDYCHMALIETKGWAIQVAQELERRTAGRKIQPLTMHWSGCSAGCGLHQVATIGLQGCRSRVNGEVVDAAHVCVNGQSGPQPTVATDLMYDLPCSRLADALEPLVSYLPRK